MCPQVSTLQLDFEANINFLLIEVLVPSLLATHITMEENKIPRIPGQKDQETGNTKAHLASMTLLKGEFDAWWCEHEVVMCKPQNPDWTRLYHVRSLDWNPTALTTSPILTFLIHRYRSLHLERSLANLHHRECVHVGELSSLSSSPQRHRKAGFKDLYCPYPLA